MQVKKRGRPTRYDKAMHGGLAVAMTDRQTTAIAREAKRQHISKSEVVRRLVNDHLLAKG